MSAPQSLRRDVETITRSMSCAEATLARIKSLGFAAHPRNYEFWYSYESGSNQEIVRAVNNILQSKEAITQEDVDFLSDALLESTSSSTEVEEVGTKIKGEIDQVMAMIELARGSADAYDTSLAGINESLDHSESEAELRLIIESLVDATRDIQNVNRELETRLIASQREISKLRDSLEVSRTESLTDPLTGLANRKMFDGSLQRLILDAQKMGAPFSLIVSDIDHFKSFNDSYGHLTGDQVLRLVATTLRQTLKGRDIPARYGGEEFAILLPNTGVKQALFVAEEIRKAVMRKELVKRSTGKVLGHITMSIGVAGFRPGDTGHALVARADSCLYTAKRTGRNRVVTELDMEPPATSTGQSRVA